MALLLTTTLSRACGDERWDVKTLQDAEAANINWEAQVTTVEELRALEAPQAPHQRVVAEQQLYVVTADILAYKVEADEDVHLVIAEPEEHTRTMVAEIPSPDCVPAAFMQRVVEARETVASLGHLGKRLYTLSVPQRVTLTGVFFFDKVHGQAGVAPNGAELHPVLHVSITK